MSNYQKSYGLRHDARPPNLTRCCASVWKDAWHHGQCGRPRGHGPDGEYCKQHDPAAVEARRKDREETYRIKILRANKPIADMLRYRDALHAIAAGHNDPRSLAAEALNPPDPS